MLSCSHQTYKHTVLHLSAGYTEVLKVTWQVSVWNNNRDSQPYLFGPHGSEKFHLVFSSHKYFFFYLKIVSLESNCFSSVYLAIFTSVVNVSNSAVHMRALSKSDWFWNCLFLHYRGEHTLGVGSTGRIPLAAQNLSTVTYKKVTNK